MHSVANVLHGRKVLIVEDIYILASEMAEQVNRLGGEVVGPTRSVTEAARLLAQGQVDLGLLDVNLNGEMVFPLAEAMADRGVPFIFLTGYDELPPAWSGHLRLEKPVNTRLLEEAIRRLA